jgi:CMP-N,N'-diacetyllegionaminic acid synthase
MLGKPLVDWSLDQLFACPRVDVVVVSTDDEALRDHALAKGAMDIGLRPAHLATDTAGKWGVWQHALEETERRVGPATAFLDLDCTNPLRLQGDIDAALDLFARERPDMVMSCTEARKNPYFNLVEPDATGALHVSKPLAGRRARAPAGAGGLRACGRRLRRGARLPQAVRRALRGTGDPAGAAHERGFDIDNPHDWEIVEFLMSRQIARGERPA